MLRVGLTGAMGSGKSTAMGYFAAHGAYVFSADEIGRALMQPGEPVYAAIVEHFGSGVVKRDGSLDRAALARMAFEGGRLEELEAIVHPATLARQAELIERATECDPNAVAIVESALIFQTQHAGKEGWAKRFDRIIFVRASDDLKIARFVARNSGGRTLSDGERTTLEEEARRRLAHQAHGERDAKRCDYILNNDGSTEDLRRQVDGLWTELEELARCSSG